MVLGLGFIRVLLTSKVLIVPALAFSTSCAAGSFICYSTGRWAGAKMFSVESDDAGSICQTASTAVGVIPPLAFFAHRYNTYRPPSFTSIVTDILNPSGSGSASTALPSKHTLETLKRALKIPAQFYGVNLLVGAALMGLSTSAAQRVLCGKTEVKVANKEKK